MSLSFSVTKPDSEKRQLYALREGNNVVARAVTRQTPIGEVRFSDLYVEPKHRRMGLAEKIIEEVKAKNKGKAIVLRARPFGKKGPDLESLKDFYRRMGFEDESKAEDRMIIKKAAIGTGILLSALKAFGAHKLGDAVVSPVVRRSNLFRNWYRNASREGLQAGWSGKPSSLSPIYAAGSGVSPTLSGAVDYGFGNLTGRQARKAFDTVVRDNVKMPVGAVDTALRSPPPVSAMINTVSGRPGASHELAYPWRMAALTASPAELGGRLSQLRSVQSQLAKYLPRIRNEVARNANGLRATATLAADSLTSPILQNMAGAVRTPANPGYARWLTRLTQHPKLSKLFRVASPTAALVGGGVTAAGAEGLVGAGVAALGSPLLSTALTSASGGLLAGLLSAAPSAIFLKLLSARKLGLISKAKASALLSGLRAGRGLPATTGDRLQRILGVVEPASGELRQAGHDIGRLSSLPGVNAYPAIERAVVPHATAPWSQMLRKDFPILKSGSAEGIPDRTRFGKTEDIPTAQELRLVLQKHLAERAGPHTDVRLGPQTGMHYSWATKKGPLPKPGEKLLWHQQPLHTAPYADFEGELKGGYGRGHVSKMLDAKVSVSEATPDKIKFTVISKGEPEYYTLIRSDYGPSKPRTERERYTQGGSWLIINTTPTNTASFLGVEPDKIAKMKYRKVPAEEVDKLFQEGNIIQNKIDGASAILKLFGDRIEATSYRASTSGAPVIHTQRLFGLGGANVKLPKDLEGTLLRGEIYGTNGDGKAIPPQELGGLLNSSIAKSLADQKARGIKMKVMPFDIVGEEDKPYAERLQKLQRITELLPKDQFHLPESATTPEEQRKLWETIRSGQHPLTYEGIVAWPKEGRPAKVKLTPEADVWVKGVVPGKGRLAGSAGGFEYSTSPEGQPVGRVGSGLTDESRREMMQEPEKWLGRMARIRAQGKFPSGAYRAPTFIARHEDYAAV